VRNAEPASEGAPGETALKEDRLIPSLSRRRDAAAAVSEFADSLSTRENPPTSVAGEAITIASCGLAPPAVDWDAGRTTPAADKTWFINELDRMRAGRGGRALVIAAAIGSLSCPVGDAGLDDVRSRRRLKLEFRLRVTREKLREIVGAAECRSLTDWLRECDERTGTETTFPG
jgi:hypothetical protein